jgi:hypothetical protein
MAGVRTIALSVDQVCADNEGAFSGQMAGCTAQRYSQVLNVAGDGLTMAPAASVAGQLGESGMVNGA